MMFDMHEMILPTPNPPFEWRSSARGPALVCGEIEPFAHHLFTTRHWTLGRSESLPLQAASAFPGARLGAGVMHEGQRPPQSAGAAAATGWHEIAEALRVNVEMLVRARQVHGRSVLVADGRLEPVPEADILVTRDATLAVAVRAADCAPILIVDPVTGAVAAAHAGWRGMAARVPLHAVAALADEYGSRPADLLAAVGPSIGACCYEVGRDVLAAFDSAGFTADQIERWFFERAPHRAGNPPFREIPTGPGRERWFFDGWAAVTEQLRDAGLRAETIFAAGLCTASHRETFCSFRRDGPGAGRLVGAIRPLRPRP
jgi:YfiH family protein